MRGRKRNPTNLKVVTGNPGKRPIKDEAEAEKLVPELKSAPPKWLPEAAKQFWKPLVKLLREMHVAKESDKTALAMLCMTLADMKEAEDELTHEGFTVPTAEGVKTNPHYTVKTKAMLIAIRLLSEFGMTPTSRSRVLGLASPAKADPFDAFLGAKKKQA